MLRTTNRLTTALEFFFKLRTELLSISTVYTWQEHKKYKITIVYAKGAFALPALILLHPLAACPDEPKKYSAPHFFCCQTTFAVSGSRVSFSLKLEEWIFFVGVFLSVLNEFLCESSLCVLVLGMCLARVVLFKVAPLKNVYKRFVME